MDLGTLLLVAVVLACPITMFVAMRNKGKGASHSRADHPGRIPTDPAAGEAEPEAAGLPGASRADSDLRTPRQE